MSAEATVSTAVEPYEKIMAANGKQPRPGQKQLILAGVGLHPGELVVCRAPTATGKSLGALITAGVRAQESGQRTVIATYTKLLQDQYALRGGESDLDLAEKLFPGVVFAVLKGANNYLCRTRAAKMKPPKVSQSNSVWNKFLLETGDPGEVKDHFGHNVLKRAAANWRTCGRHSPEECGYAAAKKRAREADVVVTNHALVLINGQNPGVLGPHDLLIVDEVHNMAAAADDYGSEEFKPNWLGGSMDAVKFGEVVQAVFGPQGEERMPKVDEVASVIKFWKMLPQADRTRLAEARDWIEAAVANKRDLLGSARLASVDWRDGEAMLRWRLVDTTPVTLAALDGTMTIQQTPGHSDGDEVEFERGVLLMSATVGTPAAPVYAVERLLGPDAGEMVSYQELASPLDYPGRMRVSLIEGPGVWGEKVYRLVKDVGGRTLVLMRSWKRVYEMEDAMVGAPVKVWVQDRESPANNHAVVEAFKADETSVLIGTRSFFEGIDVPGPSLSQVVIGELPIPMAISPVDKERQRRLGPQGWQKDVLIPQTAMGLEQQMGRLIRSPQDRGLVAILDGAAHSGWGWTAVSQAAEMYGGLTPREAAVKWWRG